MLSEIIALPARFPLLVKPVIFSRQQSWAIPLIALQFGSLGFAQQPARESSLHLEPKEVRFRILAMPRDAQTAKAKLLALGSSAKVSVRDSLEVIDLLLPRGDAAYLKAGDVCRAELVALSKGLFQAKRIWPDDPGLQSRLKQTNAALRSEVQAKAKDLALPVGSILPEFAVIDQEGELLDASFFAGKTTLVNFFFTRCSNPAMCQAATQRLKLTLKKAPEFDLPNLQALSLTFDPEHDAPGILKDYANAYRLDGKKIRLGTGPKQVMEDLRQRMGIATRKDPKLVLDHTFRIVVVDDERRIITEILGPAWSVENTLARIRKILTEE